MKRCNLPKRLMSLFLVLALLLPSTLLSGAAETTYLFNPNPDAEPYTSAPEIFPEKAGKNTVGTDGWVYKASNSLGSSEYFNAIPHTNVKGRRMLELHMTSSNHYANHNFSESVSSGVITLSADLRMSVATAAGGTYAVRLLDADGNVDKSTQLTMSADQKIKYGKSSATLIKPYTLDSWYRLTVVYDLDNATATYYMSNDAEEYAAALAAGNGKTVALEAGKTYTGLSIAGMGSGADGTLNIDRLRVFKGTPQEEVDVPVFPTDKLPESGEGGEEDTPGDYLFHPDFNADPYVANSPVIKSGSAAGAVGVDGWTLSGSSAFSSSNYFRLGDHSTTEGRQMLEYYFNTSNRQVLHAFSQPMTDGIYTMSLDFEIQIKEPGKGYYNLQLLNAKGSASAKSSIRFYGDGSVRVAGSGSGNTLATDLDQNHWYRLTVVYNFNTKKAAYYLSDNRDEYEELLADKAPFTQSLDAPDENGFVGFRIAGAGSSTSMVMHFDNWRAFSGKVEAEEPDFLIDTRPVPTRYLFNETFSAPDHALGSYLFDIGAANGTVKGIRKSGDGDHAAEYLRVIEHNKTEDDQVGELLLTSERNAVEVDFKKAIALTKGGQITVSFDVQLDASAEAGAPLYTIGMMSGDRLCDGGAVRLLGGDRYEMGGTSDAWNASSEWRRVTVCYDLGKMTADYYVDNVSVATGVPFTAAGETVTGVRVTGAQGGVDALRIDNLRAYKGAANGESDPPALVDNTQVVYQPTGDRKPFEQSALARPDHPVDYTFAWLTDSENLLQYRPNLFARNLQWLAAHRDDLNLAYVAHTGDMVGNAADGEQWNAVSDAFAALEQAGVPYGVLPGATDAQKNQYTGYRSAFGASRFDNASTYGGAYGDNVGHYDLLTVGETKFLLLSMGALENVDKNRAELAARIDWMNEVLAQYPQHRAILLLNDYLAADEGRTPVGQMIYEEVVYPNENVSLVLCGRELGARRQETAIGGRVVTEILYNYQASEAISGDGDPARYNRHMWGTLRLLQFDEQNGQIHFVTYSPLNDSVTVYDTANGDPAPAERDQFTVAFHFGQPTATLHAGDDLAADTLVYGQTVGEARVRTGWLRNSVGDAVSGTFTWEAPDTIPAAGAQTAAAHFVPHDRFYDEITVSVPLTVLPREVFVRPAHAEKKWGEADPTLTYTHGALLGSDTITGALAREAGEDAGEYAITLGTLSAGDNYTLVLIAETLTIVDDRVFVEIAGTVTSDKKPVAGATVVLKAGDEQWTTETDDKGAFTFGKRPTGSYTLSVTAEGYEAYEQVVQADAEAPIACELTKIRQPDPPQPPAIPYGDVDGDGTVSVSDACLILQRCAGIIDATMLDEKAADVDGDGQITCADACLVLQRIAKLIDTFPVENPTKNI